MTEKLWCIESVCSPDVYIFKAECPEKEEVWGWLQGHREETKIYCFHQRCISWGQKLVYNSMGYFNGLVYLFFYKPISHVLIARLFQAFIFTSGSDNKPGTDG